MLVMRKANKEDVNYCYKLIISNVKHGHFDNALNNLVNRFIFKMRMAKWIKSNTYTNPYEKSDIMKTQTYQFIYLKKIGFQKYPENINHVIFSKEYTKKTGT